MVLRKLVNHLSTNETRTLSNTKHKKNSKWIKDLNIRPETIKLLAENIGKTLSDINHSRILYDPLPRILEIEAKMNKWDLIKIKTFCTTKETISKVKRQPSEWEKIIANEAMDKELIFLTSDYTTKLQSSRQYGTGTKTDPCTYGHFIFDKGGRNRQWREDNLFNKWC